MQDKQAEAFERLFTAKWNIPQAVNHIGKAACFEEWESMKQSFREYCSKNLATWVSGDTYESDWVR